MDFELWIAFVAASAAVLLTPGPTVLFAVGSVARLGGGAVLPLAAGAGLGVATALAAMLLGLGQVVDRSGSLLGALRWAGSAYLVWLGLWMWRGGRARRAAPCRGRAAGLRLTGQAWLIAVLNPMTAAFQLALLPQVLDPEAGIGRQASVLVPTLLVLGFGNALAYGTLAARAARLLASPPAMRALHRAGGAGLVILGLWTAARAI